MKFEFIIIIITIFLVVNTYYDGKYTKMLQVSQKYIKMAMFGFIGLSLYLFFKKHPKDSASMLTHASDIIKYMPIDKNTSDIITPFFDFTKARNSLNTNLRPQEKRMIHSGINSNKRSVSETKKKYVASKQGWKCNTCHKILDACFESDHKTQLYKGGTNHIDNLEALCRNCHGAKTIHDKII